ncbi:hypothetical protein NC651_031091 [Populus alba x Populus x berolinensis]|nr:hypothetical protein NC651_031091 [Populus alba x Populus x berolinensis]
MAIYAPRERHPGPHEERTLEELGHFRPEGMYLFSCRPSFSRWCRGGGSAFILLWSAF